MLALPRLFAYFQPKVTKKRRRRREKHPGERRCARAGPEVCAAAGHGPRPGGMCLPDPADSPGWGLAPSPSTPCWSDTRPEPSESIRSWQHEEGRTDRHREPGAQPLGQAAESERGHREVTAREGEALRFQPTSGLSR